MRQAYGLIFVLVLGVAGAVAQEAAKKDKEKDYYPLKPGTKWSYEMNGGGQKINLVNQVAKTEDIDGKSLAVVETTMVDADGKPAVGPDGKPAVGPDGKPIVTATEHMETTDKGVFRHRINGIALSPPVCLLKYPFKKDETWESDTTVGAEQLKVKGKAIGTEEIEVNGKKYQTVKAEVETTVAGMLVSAIYWFAPTLEL